MGGEWREMMWRHDSEKGWAQAKRVLAEVLRRVNGRVDEGDIGYVRFLGEGLSHRAFGAGCRLGDRDVGLVVRLPVGDVDREARDEGLRREVSVLEYLGTLELPIRTPKPVMLIETEHGLACVQSALRGVLLEMRASRQPGVRSWDVVAEVAAACHRVEAEPLRATLLGSATRREHAQAGLAVLDRLAHLGIAGVGGAREWAEAHLPPDDPASLIHGDLLGQNILLDVEDGGLCLGVLDWCAASLGDPAYDLAIVTRGAKQPFQVPDGLDKMLTSYSTHGQIVRREEVHVHELALQAGFVLDDIAHFGCDAPPAEQAIRRFESFLRRVR
jgi:aminoglycoside phosphotransferase (APT) family kinase protein